MTGMTDEHWRQVGTIFKQIHQAIVPSTGFELLQNDTFDPAGYTRWVRTFELIGAPSRTIAMNGSCKT
jgi:spectinomycin phosphotransferase